MKTVARYAVFFFILVTASFVSCKKDYSYEHRKGDLSPIANAGQDQIILLPKDSVLLDGSASTDPDGSITSFNWQKITGPSATLRRPNVQTTAVTSLVKGIYEFELTVTDNTGHSASDTVSITVSDAQGNKPPVAIAFWDSLNNLPPGSKFVTAKFSTDPDGMIVSYKWMKIGGPSSFTINTPQSLETIISNLVQGTYAFELTVTDNGGLTAKDTVMVYVGGAATTKIIANAGPDQTVSLPLDSTYLDGGASAPNGFTGSPATIFTWTTIAGPTQYVLKPTSVPVAALAKTSMLVDGLVPGVYLFTFAVTEPGVGSAIDTVKVTVVNDPLNRNSVTYHDLIWEEADPFGLSWLTTFISSPLRPDIFDNAGVNRGVEISLKLNAFSPWTVVPFRTHDPFNSDVVPYVAAILTNPSNPLLVGLKSNLRIRFP